MDLYLGAQGSTLYSAAAAAPTSSSAQDQDLSGLLIDRATGSSLLQHVKLDTATSKAMKDLKMEVQERLGRLQQTLCI